MNTQLDRDRKLRCPSHTRLPFSLFGLLATVEGILRPSLSNSSAMLGVARANRLQVMTAGSCAPATVSHRKSPACTHCTCFEGRIALLGDTAYVVALVETAVAKHSISIEQPIPKTRAVVVKCLQCSHRCPPVHSPQSTFQVFRRCI